MDFKGKIKIREENILIVGKKGNVSIISNMYLNDQLEDASRHTLNNSTHVNTKWKIFLHLEYLS